MVWDAALERMSSLSLKLPPKHTSIIYCCLRVSPRFILFKWEAQSIKRNTYYHSLLKCNFHWCSFFDRVSERKTILMIILWLDCGNRGPRSRPVLTAWTSQTDFELRRGLLTIADPFCLCCIKIIVTQTDGKETLVCYHEKKRSWRNSWALHNMQP